MKISIITVCYNSASTIEDTIQSVLQQSYKDFEYIIIDGKSTDDTLKIINKYSNDKRIKLISEKDNGIYDAMNKGINISTGDVIAMINSDDILYNENVFQTVIDNFNKETDIVYANVMYCNDDYSKIIRNYISGTKKNNAWCPAHPSMYVRKHIYRTIGLYNIKYKICADYDFMVRCNKNNVRYKYVNQYFVKMRYGGASNGIKGYIANFFECCQVLKNNGIHFPLFHTISRTLYTLKQIYFE